MNRQLDPIDRAVKNLCKSINRLMNGIYEQHPNAPSIKSLKLEIDGGDIEFGMDDRHLSGLNDIFSQNEREKEILFGSLIALRNLLPEIAMPIVLKIDTNLVIADGGGILANSEISALSLAGLKSSDRVYGNDDAFRTLKRSEAVFEVIAWHLRVNGLMSGDRHDYAIGRKDAKFEPHQTISARSPEEALLKYGSAYIGIQKFEGFLRKGDPDMEEFFCRFFSDMCIARIENQSADEILKSRFSKERDREYDASFEA